MAETPELFPLGFKRLWSTWNLRGFILLSLALQTFLVLFAPLRKRTAHKLVIMSIWSGYLLADWAANFAVGLISSSQGDDPSDESDFVDNPDILAFWAPFLLLHLGGPDTITAFALEDNELWLRHLLGLVFQVIAAAYVFLQSFPSNRLLIPTVLMLLAGIVKYAERTRALYLASMDRFRESMLKEPDPGPNYAKLMGEYNSKKDARVPTRIVMMPEPDKDFRGATDNVKKGKLDDLEVVHYAYGFFETFKGLIVDLIFSFRERNESRQFFLQRSAEDAFKVIELELNFIYQVFYTKVVVVHCKMGYFFRFISFSLVVVALALFYDEDKKDFDWVDVTITYTLLLGAIALDTIALLMLAFSIWTISALMKSGKKSFAPTIIKNFLIFMWSRWSKYSEAHRSNNLVLVTRFLFRRWSKTVSTYNLIGYCLKECPIRKDRVAGWKEKVGFLSKIKKWISKATGCLGFLKDFLSGIKKLIGIYSGLNYFLSMIKKLNGIVTDYLGLKTFLDEIKYVYREPFSEELKKFIFDELKMKSEIADDPETAKEICEARGNWVLRERSHGELLHWVDDVEYDKSILLWHIATELCYNTEEHPVDGRGPDNSTEPPPEDSRDFCKTLSDYMLYLLVMQLTMMSAVAGIGQIRFRDTCAEAKKFFDRRELQADVKGYKSKSACENILEVNTDVKPVDVKGDRSKSVLFDACILAKELKKLGGEKWNIMSKVWVELLSYAASHCRANTHAQQVSKGGELVTFVWLLMAHFGLGGQFQINAGHARAKLIVGK